MAPYRESARGEVEVFPHRVKTWLMTVGIVLFALVSALAAIDDPRAWWAWAGLALFGGGGLVWLRRHWRAGLFMGRPILVLGPDGLDDRQSGVQISWDEVERVEFWEMQLPRSTESFVGLWLSHPDSVSARFPAAWRMLSELNEAALPGRPPFNVSTTLLATTRQELAGLIGRFYRGPIEGIDDEIDTTPERPSRLRRFGAWALGWAFAIVIAAAVVALVLWLS